MGKWGTSGATGPTSRRFRGTGLAIVAALLAVTGLVLSYFHARALTRERTDTARRYAQSLALIIAHRLAAEVKPILAREDERMTTGLSGRNLHHGGKPTVHWLETVLVWEGQRLEPSPAWRSLPGPVLQQATTLMATRSVMPGRTTPDGSDRPPGTPGAGAFPIQAGEGGGSGGSAGSAVEVVGGVRSQDIEGSNYFLSWLADGPGAPTPPAPVAVGDKGSALIWLIPTEMLDRAGLEIASGGESDRPWWEPLPAGLSFWRIQPTEQSVHLEHEASLQQMLLFGPVIVLSLTALMALIWQMSRVVQREKALSAMKSDFVAGVSHELKTPLALIHLFGETLLERRVADEDKKREYYTIIVRESTRLSNLINNLLDFAKIDSDRKRYDLTPGDVGEVVRQTYETYRFDLDHERMEHALRIEPDLPKVAIDRDAISQAIVNLMSNAVKYSGDDRHLFIEVQPDTRRGRHGVLISVHDRGIGIAPEDRNRIFDGFFRARDAHVRNIRGTGLGLSLVKHIVEAHGGIISVESRLIKGTTFRIFLPAAETETTDETETSGETEIVAESETAAGAAPSNAETATSETGPPPPSEPRPS